MKINEVLSEMTEQQIYDAKNLPDELEIGEVFGNKATVMGSTVYADKFKVEKKIFDKALNTYFYVAFSLDRTVPHYDPDEAWEYDYFKFSIQNGRIKPAPGFGGVITNYNF